jgi:uncharacterized membrane protein
VDPGWDRLRLGAVGLLGLVGIGIAAYLTFVHASAAPLVCSANGVVDCARVLNSAYGQILGTQIPTSAAGILWFAVSAALAALQLRRPDSRPIWGVHVAWGVAGLLTVLYLVYVEIVRVGSICAWCTGAHVVVVLSFLLVVTRWTAGESGAEPLEGKTAGA